MSLGLMRTQTNPGVLGLALTLLCVSAACKTGPPIPSVQADPPASAASFWARATIVAVGTIGVPHQTGRPQIAKLWNTPTSVYPCEASFQPRVIVKGDAQTIVEHSQLLWFSVFRSCSFGLTPDWKTRSAEQIWFFRTEGPWLRPVFNPGATFIELFQRFEVAGTDSESRRHTLSRYLLDPTATSENELRFSQRFWDFYQLSTEVSGEQWTQQVLGDLQRRASATVKEMICLHLAGVDQCRYSACPAQASPAGTLSPRGDRDQAGYKSNALLESSEELVKSRLGSSETNAMELAQLLRLSCHFDPLIRGRATKLLNKYYPDSRAAPCVSCQ